jgi:adenosylcobyric acid synthase
MFKDIAIEEEDSVELSQKRRSLREGKTNIAVVLLRHISNFTDFGVLERDERVNLFYTSNTDDIEKADIVILPGTKATLDDLYELRRNGVAQSIVRAHAKGTLVLGICGGYQMLGQTVSDPDGVEGGIPQLPGLGLLPMHTRMQGGKVTRQVRFSFRKNDEWSERNLQGYEIHQGETSVCDESAEYTPLCRLDDGSLEGCSTGERCFGTYIHGILDNKEFIDWLLSKVSSGADTAEMFSHEDFKQKQYDLLADHLRKYVDVDAILSQFNGNI